MRSAALAAAALALVTLTTPAEAKKPRAAKPKTSKVLVASAVTEPLPALPAPSPAPATPAAAPAAAPSPAPAPAADKPAAPPAPARYEESPTGATFDLSGGLRFVSGAMSKDAESFNAFGLNIGFRGGYYFTRHFGVLAGVEGSYGFMGKGCVSNGRSGKEATCDALSMKLPLVAQYAFSSRTRGAYVEGGLSFVNFQFFTAKPTPDTTQTLTMFSPVDLALGAGYRVDFAPDAKTKAGGGILDLSVRADVGQYTKGSASIGDRSFSGEVPAESRALHVALTLNVARRF